MQVRATHMTTLTIELPNPIYDMDFGIVSSALLAIDVVKDVTLTNPQGAKLEVAICTGVGSHAVTDAGLLVQDAVRRALGIPEEG